MRDVRLAPLDEALLDDVLAQSERYHHHNRRREGMPLSSYMYAFSPRPERGADFAQWARTTGVPFWLSRPGLRSYRTYRVHAGSGATVALAEFESAEALGRVLDSPEWATVLGEFQSYVADLQSWVLGPGATGDEPLRPTQPAASGGERA